MRLSEINCFASASRTLSPLNSFQCIGARRRQALARRQRQETRRQQLAVKWYFAIVILLISVSLAPTATGAVTEKNLPDSFTDVINRFSSLQDRSTGTAGNAAAAQYLKEKFEKLGYKDVGSYRFSVPIIQHAGSQLTLSKRNRPIDLHPIIGNSVTPQTIAATGLSVPLIYAGRGALAE